MVVCVACIDDHGNLVMVGGGAREVKTMDNTEPGCEEEHKNYLQL